MKDQPSTALAELFDNGAEVDRRVREAIRAAVADHKRTGDPVVIWRDGQVVLLPPDQIELLGLTAAEGKDLGLEH